MIFINSNYREFITIYYSMKNLSLKSLIILIFFSVFLHAQTPPLIPEGWSDGYVYDNGIRVHYYHAIPAPNKPVMIMVHGVTDNGLCWTTLTQELQKEYNVYMLDARGHGLSDPFTTTDDGETLVKDVVGFVEAMSIEDPILVGHSMGAATVMRIGAEYPDLTQSIIMLDPFLASLNPRPQNQKAKQPEQNNRKPETKATKPQKRLSINMFAPPETLVKQNNYSFEELVEKGYNDFPKWNSVDIQCWALSKKQYHGPYNDNAWKAMHGTMNIGDALSKITVPALVLKADTSPDSRKINEEAVKGLKGVKLIHIDGAGHNLHHDELDRTLMEIQIFLQTIK